MTGCISAEPRHVTKNNKRHIYTQHISRNERQKIFYHRTLTQWRGVYIVSQMNIIKNRPNKKSNIHKDKKNNTITRNWDDKQRQYLESLLQDHRVWFVKLIRNIDQQDLGIFWYFYLRKGWDVL